ncbi:hypothetical protein GN958_ATG22183 [Phytophthora infestans]|uniref:FYVE-type domain-containing protein n=1 Tax=Phytophthora infestans TaxID=4787 RepID=A0A8S9TQ06_PHYIN|nr:hypothetical protein GN958_ATG22183 [Phytophthora infestans]
MPKQLHLSFLSYRKQSPPSDGLNGDHKVLGDLGESCLHPNSCESSRRRPHLTSSMRTVPADRPSPAVSPWVGFESDGHLPMSRKVCVSDAELIHRACSASLESRRGRLLRVPTVTWDCKEISGFAMLSRQMGASGEDFEVLTTGEVACEPSELEPLLRPLTESEYNAVARDFFGDQFIYGSIVHEVQRRGFDNELSDDSERQVKDSEDFTLYAEDHVAVRTACFARSRRFSRNEEWCFLEHFRPRSVAPTSPFTTTGSSDSSTSSVNIDDPTGFSIVMTSMPECELTAGKMKKERVTQLHGITATYLVEPLPQTVGCRGPRVRVSFHATFTAATNVPEGYADAQTVRTRLTSLARSLHRLPEMVQQRQQQATQCSLRCSYSNPSGQEYRDTLEASNSRCVACTKRLRMKLLDTPTRRSKRCQICMYRACASCWSKESVETFKGHTTSMIVCRRCHENFGSSDYSHIQLT